MSWRGKVADIYRRPQEEIRGNKWPWTAAAFVNFVGPTSYSLIGRKRYGGADLRVSGSEGGTS
jgi:hypothetical protein